MVPANATYRKVVSSAILCALTICWAIAATSKARDLQRLQDAITGLLPAARPVSGLLAVGLIAAEVAAAVLLLAPRTRFAGLSGSFLLASGFAGVNLVRWHEGVRAPCSCFGVLYTAPPWAALTIDLAILAASAYALGIALQEERQ